MKTYSLFKAVFLAVTSGLLIAACVSSAKRSTGMKVFVTDSKAVMLLPPEDAWHDVDTIQFFTGSYGGTKMAMIAYTECTTEKISVVMMNDLGIEIASLLYTASGLSLKSSFLPVSAKPEYIVMDFQNVYYNPDALCKLYSAAGLSFTVCNDDGFEVRTIAEGNTIIEVIEKSPEGIVITNYLRNYKYTLKEAEDYE